MKYRLLLNPGSTSTKVSVYANRSPVFTRSVQHSQEDLARFPTIVSQRSYREAIIADILAERGILQSDLEAVMAIGGLIKPGNAGVYRVNADMVRDLEDAHYDEHASNLGALIAYSFAVRNHIPAFVADAVTADEMADIARISGIPEIRRSGRAHTLNQKFSARRAANELHIAYAEARLVVAHLGGGISVAAHRNGKMVDTNAARGEGPFCIDRSGGVNAFELAKMCFSGKFTKDELLRKINGNGGIVAYLGTRDFREVERRANAGDGPAAAVFQSLAYQISKEIAAMTVALCGKADAIVLTGGMANSKKLCSAIRTYVDYLAKIIVYPGEGEQEALAEYADLVLSGQLTPMEYVREEV